MLRFFVVALLILIGTPASARTVLVYGDSLSAGYGLPRDRAWPALLALRLRQERLDYTVANASISGETSVGGARRIAATLAKHQPEVVVLALGANDGLRGHSIEATRSNLELIINQSLKSGAQVVLVGMQLPPNYGGDYIGKFRAVYTDLAKKYQLWLVPFLLEGFAGNADWFQPDGLHPAIKAQPRMLDNVWGALQPALVAQSKKSPRIP